MALCASLHKRSVLFICETGLPEETAPNSCICGRHPEMNYPTRSVYGDSGNNPLSFCINSTFNDRRKGEKIRTTQKGRDGRHVLCRHRQDLGPLGEQEPNVKFSESIFAYRWESSYPLFGHGLHQYLRDLVCIDPNAGLQTNNSKLNPRKGS